MVRSDSIQPLRAVMGTSWLAILLLAVALPSGAAAQSRPDGLSSSPSSAETHGFVPDLVNCGRLYRLAHEAKTPNAGELAFGAIGGPSHFERSSFFKHSNAQFIDYEGRLKVLNERFPGGEAAWEVGTSTALSVRPTSSEAGFPTWITDPTTGAIRGPSRGDTPALGRQLAQCDMAHRFTPVFWFGAPEPITCAVTLLMFGIGRGSDDQGRAVSQANAAIAVHVAAYGCDVGQINTAVTAGAQSRYQRIQTGVEPAAGWQRDLSVCRREFAGQPQR